MKRIWRRINAMFLLLLMLIGLLPYDTQIKQISAEEVTDDCEIPSGAVCYNGHYYFFYDDELYTWEEAEEYCESVGGYLATITSGEEQKAIYSYLEIVAEDEDVWIGITDSNAEGDWNNWITGEAVSYTNWGENEPDNYFGDQNYGVICNGYRDGGSEYFISPGQWDDVGWNNNHFLCEWGDVDSADVRSSTSGFTLGVDNNNYAHSRSSDIYVNAGFVGFTTYALDTEYYEKLIENASGGEIRAIQKKMKAEYEGVCHGIALTLALQYNGYIEISDLSSENVDSYYELSYPYCDNKLMNTIKYYHLTQYIEDYEKAKTSFVRDNGILSGCMNSLFGYDSINTFLEKLVTASSSKYVEILGYSTKDTSHTILVTGCEYFADENKYVLTLYDENSVTMLRKEYANLYDKCSYPQGYFITMEVSGDFSEFEFVDAIGNTITNNNIEYIYFMDYESMVNLVSSSEDKDDEEDSYTRIIFPKGSSFTLLNESGESLSYDGEKLDGDMTVYDVNIISGDNSSDEENNSDIVITVDNQNSYEIQEIDESVDVEIYNDTDYIALEGTNIESGNLSFETGIVVKGSSEYTFTATVSTGLSAAEMVSVTSNAIGTTQLITDGNDVKLVSEDGCSDVTIETYKGTEYTYGELDDTVTEITFYDNDTGELELNTNAVEESGTCGDNVTWELNDDGELIISGYGNMTDWNKSSSVPWFALRSSITKVSISEGVTSIGDYAFSFCSKVVNVTLSSSVLSIGDYAFYGCNRLTTLVIPATVKTMGIYAVGYMSDSDDNPCYIEDFALYGCENSAAENYAYDNEIEFICSQSGLVNVIELEDIVIEDFWSSFTEGIEIKEGQKIVMNGTSKNNGQYNWDNAIFLLYSCDDNKVNGENYNEYFVGRIDNYGWGTAGYNITSDPEDWDNWLSITQEGAEFEITITYSDGVIRVLSSCEGAEYEVSYDTDDDLTYYVALTGEECTLSNLSVNYYEEESANFISEKDVCLSENDFTYDGVEKKPSVTVTYNDSNLILNTDYIVIYGDNVNAGIATVTVIGIGDYKGAVEKTFTISKATQTITASIAKDSITYGKTTNITASTTGDGSLSYSSSNTSVATVSGSGTTATVKAKGAGTATITIKAAATDNYNSATKTVTITVTRASQSLSVSSSSVSLAAGGNSTPTVSGAKTSLSYKSSDTSVATVSSSGKIKAKAVGTATITVTAAQTSAYSKATKTIKVTVKPAATTISSVENTSSGVKITWKTVTGATGYYVYRATSASGTYTYIATIKSGSTVTYTNKTSGDYKVSSGKKYYYKVSAYASTGTASKSSAKSILYLTAGKISSLTNTSSGITVKWTKVTGASGYYVYRKASTDDSYTRVIIIKSSDTVSYTDKKINSKNGTTYTYYVQPYYSTTKGAYVEKTTVRMTAVSISSLKNSSSKKMTVKWAKNSKASGYQIQYSTSSTFKSGNKTVTVSKASTTSNTIKNLTKNKTYYVRVRTYKTVSGTKYYSAWSTKKSVKISK